MARTLDDEDLFINVLPLYTPRDGVTRRVKNEGSLTSQWIHIRRPVMTVAVGVNLARALNNESFQFLSDGLW